MGCVGESTLLVDFFRKSAHGRPGVFTATKFNGRTACHMKLYRGLVTTLELVTIISIGNESVPKIIINDAIKLFLTAMCILVISNRNSF